MPGPPAKRPKKKASTATDHSDCIDIASKIAAAYSTDPTFADDKKTTDWILAEGIWWHKDKIVVPDCKAVKEAILHEFHDSSYAGHLGTRRIVRNILRYFTWSNIWAEAEAYIKHCPSCQVNKGTCANGLMQPKQVPPKPWHTVTTDYVTGFPETADNLNAIAVFVDALTIYVILVPCSKSSSGMDWAHMFMDNVYAHFGLPEHILSDRGTQFTGCFNQSLAEQLGYPWKLTTAHAPWSDGQTECTNCLLEDVLRHFVSADMHDWKDHLSTVEFAIDNAWQETVQETPMYLNFGRHPKTPLTVNLPTRPAGNPAAGDIAVRMCTLSARAKCCMMAAQQRQKRFYGNNRTDVAFGVGTEVLFQLLILN